MSCSTAIVLVISWVLHADAGRKTLVVPDAYASIQQAIDSARPGDTIFVKPGVYEGALIVQHKAVSLRGEDRDKVIVRAPALADPVLTVRGCEKGTVSSSRGSRAQRRGPWIDIRQPIRTGRIRDSAPY